MNKNYIVLNGKRYDATTGALLGVVADIQGKSVHKPTPRVQASRVTQDIKPTTILKPVAKPDRAHHGTPKHVAPRKPTGSKTLMRSAVKKPSATNLPTIKKQYPALANSSVIAQKLSVKNIDPKRMARARQIGKSAQIGKFQDVSNTRITPHIKPLAVATPPAAIASAPHRQSFQPPAHHPTPKKRKEQLFERALQNATSHEQPAHKPHKTKRQKRSKHRRLVHSFASMSAVLVIGGSIAYANKSSVELQLASVRAGFQASAPGYAPAGFEPQETDAQKGKVAIHFASPLDRSNFTLTQEASDWDSQTLFDSIVAQNNSSYQTVLSGGRTVFMYGNNEAAWVDGGILYKVQGNASLTKDQISSLASSM